MNTTSSGSHHLATRPSRNSRTSSLVSVSPGLHHHARQRPLGPLGVLDADDGGLGHLGVGHDLVLELDRADPLARPTSPRPWCGRRCACSPRRRPGGDVAGLEPAVGGERLGRAGVVVVGRGDPRAARPGARRGSSPSHGTGSRPTSGSTTRSSTPRSGRPMVARRSASSSSDRSASVDLMLADGGHRAGLGHAPGLEDRAARSAPGRPPTAPWAPPSRRTGWPAGDEVSRPFSSGEHAHPDGGDAGGHGDPLLSMRSARALGERSGPGMIRSAPVATPAWARPQALAWNIGTTGQDPVATRRTPMLSAPVAAKVCSHAGAVAVHDALGVARGAARVAHRRRPVLVGDVELDGLEPRPAASRSRAARADPASGAGRPARRP